MKRVGSRGSGESGKGGGGRQCCEQAGMGLVLSTQRTESIGTRNPQGMWCGGKLSMRGVGVECSASGPHHRRHGVRATGVHIRHELQRQPQSQAHNPQKREKRKKWKTIFIDI